MDSNTDQAHRLVLQGEDLENAHKYQDAALAYYTAAERYLMAASDCPDPKAELTLKKLSSEYTKKAKLMERRATQAAQAAQAAQSSPQPSPATPSPQTHTANSDEEIPSAPASPPSPQRVEQEEDPLYFQGFVETLQQLVHRLPVGVAFAMAPNWTTPTVEKKAPGPLQPDANLLESFFLVPGNEEENNRKLIEDLKRENALLREQLEAVKKQEELEQVVKENELLRSSIIHFKQEVESQVKKFHGPSLRSSTLPGRQDTAGSVQLRVPSSDLAERLRRAEEENALLKKENTELTGKVRKYKERWAKIKSSTEKRRNEHQARGASSLDSLSQVSVEESGQGSSSVFFSTSDTLASERDLAKKGKPNF